MSTDLETAGLRRIRGEVSDYDELLRQFGDRPFVLLGEASHGTREFYRERARITRLLVEQHDVVAILGQRSPTAAESPRVHRQAFVFVVGLGRTVDNAQVSKIDRIRREWQSFFNTATDGRMQAITTLAQ